jgi:hypothetical protein
VEDIVPIPEQGGLVVLNLEIHNKCLLSKWLFKLINNDRVWQQLFRNKYLRNKSLTHVQYMPGDSQFWAGIMKVKTKFLPLGKFDLGDRSQLSSAILGGFVDKIPPTEIALSYTLQYCEKKKYVCTISDVYNTVKCSL